MRDHHFQMLSPRSFARWKERNQIHFNYGDWLSTDETLRLEGEQVAKRAKRSKSSTPSGVTSDRGIDIDSSDSEAESLNSAFVGADEEKSNSRSGGSVNNNNPSAHQRGHMSRRVYLDIPRCYSRRSQCVVSSTSNRDKSKKKEDNEDSKDDTEDVEDVGMGGASYDNKDDTEDIEDIEDVEDVGMGGASYAFPCVGGEDWLCCYRKSKSTSTSTNTKGSYTQDTQVLRQTRHAEYPNSADSKNSKKAGRDER